MKADKRQQIRYQVTTKLNLFFLYRMQASSHVLKAVEEIPVAAPMMSASHFSRPLLRVQPRLGPHFWSSGQVSFK